MSQKVADPAAEAAAAAGAGRAKKSNRQKILEQITSLDDDDDERATISKKISWILRHGAKKVNVKMTDDGWVKISDLNKVEILDEVPNVKLMSVIMESNNQKPRYDLVNSAEGQWIKAISKVDRKAAAEKTSRHTPAVPSAVSIAPRDHHKDSNMRTDAPEFVPTTTPVPDQPTTYAPPAAGYPGYPYPFGAAGYPYPFGAYPPAMMSPYAAMAAAAAPPAPVPFPVAAGRFRGRIKAFNSEKGFGFIECQEAHAKYGRDVFLHKAHIGELPVGSEVSFGVELNKSGMPQARDLATSQGMVPGQPSKGKDGGKGKGKGKSGDGEGKGKGAKAKGKKEKKDGKDGLAKEAKASDAKASDAAEAPKTDEAAATP